MRPPRFRLTVRGLMAAVAVVGVASGAAARLARRSAAFRREVVAHALLAREHHVPSPSCLGPDPPGPHPDQRLVDYHHGLVDKYAYAASHPWLPVEPDPPPPE